MFCICEHDYVEADTKKKQTQLLETSTKELGRWT